MPKIAARLLPPIFITQILAPSKVTEFADAAVLQEPGTAPVEARGFIT